MVSTLRTKALRAQVQRENAAARVEELHRKRDAVQARVAGEELALVLIQQAALDTQQQLRYHLEELVQHAIDAVFPGKYTFRVAFEIKNGRTGAQIYLDKDGTRMDPMDSNGGGVVDIISLALRIASWGISRTRPVLLLDEPFKFLSARYRPLIGEMLSGVAHRLGLQVIMVTHDPDMVEIADRVFTIDQKERKSFIAEVTK